MSKDLKNPSHSVNNQKPKSRTTTFYSDDEEKDDKFEVDEDIDINAAVPGRIIDAGIGKIAAQGSQTSVPSSLAVGDEDFDWNAV
jgi:hypothetical protein